MSSHEQALATVISHLALSFDGAFLGVALAYVSVKSFLKFRNNASALRKIRSAPSLRVADLRDLLQVQSEPSDQQQQQGNEEIAIVHGSVEAKSTVDSTWKVLNKDNILVAQVSHEKAVVVKKTQTCIYNEWKGFFGWASDIRAIFGRSWREQESTSLRTVPFVIVEAGQWPHLDYVVVNMDGSNHPVPLVTVYHQLLPVDASPYTFLQALFGHEYPVGFLEEEKILPLGKDITAVGLCSIKNGIPEIKSCKDLPYFLTDMTKDQMVLDLAFKSKILLWSGIVLGSLSIGILGYAIVRNWNRWKEWRQGRQFEQTSHSAIDDTNSQIVTDDEAGDVPDGQLCVICLTKRRRTAFSPCGHLVCCQPCALSVQREGSPKCPVCRQAVRSSIRIYDS